MQQLNTGMPSMNTGAPSVAATHVPTRVAADCLGRSKKWEVLHEQLDMLGIYSDA